MPSLLNLFRSRKERQRTPPDSVDNKLSSTRTSNSPPSSPASLHRRRHRRHRGRNDDNKDRHDDDDEVDETLRSSDISVSIEVKEAAPMSDRLFRRIASFRRIGLTSMRNDRTTGQSKRHQHEAEAKAENNKKKDKERKEEEMKDLKEEEEEEEEDYDEAVSVSMPLPACRRRRVPIRLRDVLCWPYAGATDDAAEEYAAVHRDERDGKRMSAAEIERLYSVQEPAPQPPAGCLAASSTKSAATAEPAPPSRLPSPNLGLAAKEPDESSWRLLAAEQLKEFLERRRRRRVADETPAAAAAAVVANEGDNADVEIGVSRVYTAEQRRVRPREQRNSPVGDISVHCLAQDVTSSATTGSSASSFSPSSGATASASPMPASTNADIGSTSPRFVFADLVPLETGTADKPEVSSDTSQESASYLIATLRLTNGTSVDRLQEPED